MTIENIPHETQETILYPDSGYTIQYGPSPPEDFPPTYCEPIQYSGSSIAAFIETAKCHFNEAQRTRLPRDSLLAQHQRLFQAAAVMVTAASRAGTTTSSTNDPPTGTTSTTDLPNVYQEKDFQDLDESETQVPNLSPNPLPATDESQTQLLDILQPPDESLTLLLPSSPDESQTQLPDLTVRHQEAHAQPPPDGLVIVPPRKPRGRPRKSPITVSPVVHSSPSLPEFWSDCPDVYPEPKEIALALQDPGKEVVKMVNGVRQPCTTYPLIQKLCLRIYQQIQALYKPEGLTKNSTRGRESLAGFVTMARKLTDAMNLDVFFHPYAKNGQVYTITNNPRHSGLDIPLKEFQVSVTNMLRKARSSRTANDGLRLSLTLLDPKYRESVSLIMSNRKDRTQTDISGDHIVHFFEKINHECFKNPFYKPPEPSQARFGDIDEEEYSSWNPNDAKIFEVDRSTSWLMETWKVYVKRKYKSALDRWNKETGGGNGQSWSFVNYCDKDARWLVVVFLKDIDANYLLASNAGGRMPNHLQMESGVEGSPDTSSFDESSDEQTRVSAKKRAIVNEQNETKKLKSDLSDVVLLLSSVYKEKQQEKEEAQRTTPEPKETYDDVLAQVEKLTNKLQDEDALKLMPSTTRADYIESLQSRLARMVKKLKKLEEEDKTNE